MAAYRIGFGKADITPKGAPSSLAGQFETRITEEVHDPLEVNCLYIESEDGVSIWASCDTCQIFKSLSDDVDAMLSGRMEGFRPGMLMISATHIHTGPYHDRGGWLSLTGNTDDDEGAMTAAEYRAQMAEGIVQAVLAAKADLKDVSVELSIAPVITGVNRRVVYADGSAKMYGALNGKDFYRMEARDGGPTQLLYVYREPEHRLDGVIANVPCTAQCDEHACYLTADYWEVVRKRIAEDWGEDVHVFSIVRSAGDLSPHPMVDRYPGEEAYQSGRLCAERMGNWVADVIELFRDRPERKLAGKVHRHVSRELELPVWAVSEEEYADARTYMADPANYPDGRPANAFAHANAWTRIRRVEQDAKTVKTRINAVRLDDVVMLSTPFELYIAYADRIRMRVPHAIVFDVELSYDSLGYLATREAVRGGHYSANIFNGVCDPDGGDLLVERCVEIIQSLF